MDEITEEVFDLLSDNAHDITYVVTRIHDMYENEEYVLAFFKFGLNFFEAINR